MKDAETIKTIPAGATLASAAPLRSTTRVQSNALLALRRFMRHRLPVIGLVITLLLLFTAVFAPLLAPKSYIFSDLSIANQPPSRQYPMGTDTIGHEYLSRIIYGVRTSLLVGFGAVLLAAVLGVPLGLIAGLRGG